MSLFIDRGGYIDAERIIVKIFPRIERGAMDVVNGIVVHQTGGSNAASTFNSYMKTDVTPNGAHFLIDKDGTIYQTASLFRATNHVGLLQSRCVIKHQCTPAEFEHSMKLQAIRPVPAMAKAVHRNEERKPWPDRFPSNADSVGIECVGEWAGDRGKEKYVPLTDAQNESLKWLVKELAGALGVSMTEVYRHPEIGRKNETEARSAKW